ETKKPAVARFFKPRLGIHLEISASSIFDENGEIAGIVHLAKNITERKQIEEAYRTIANSSQVGIYIVQDGQFRFTNSHFQEHTGFNQDELLGMDPSRLVHPEDRDRVRQNAIQMLKGTSLPPYELRITDKNGKSHWAMETVTSIYYNERKATLGNFMDITERKQIEEKLRESEEKWRSLVESSPNIIMVVGRDNTIEFINHTVPGINVEDTIGRSIYDYIQPEYHDVVRKAINRVFETGEPDGYEINGVGPEGRLSWYETKIGPMKHDGQIVAVLQITSDITERKQAEHDIGERIKELQCLYGISKLANKPDVTLDKLYQEVANMLPQSWQYPEVTCAQLTIDGKEFKTANYRETK
ncbi:PAS domain-containing protein, partial [Chloroflexota bacterium]